MSETPFEKTGNANWVQCPDCEHWFHVAASLLAAEGVDLICPGCGKPFAPDDAKALVRN